jgi:hypothetical protein
MFPNFIHLYASQFSVGSGLVQPTIELGIPGTPAYFRAPWQTTGLTAALVREIQDMFLTDDAVAAFLLTITAPATGITTMKGFALIGGDLIPAP